MIEVRERGEQVIRRDVLAKQHDLSERQAKQLGLLIRKGTAHIIEIEEICPGVSRRTLQRDLLGLIEQGLVRLKGSARQSNYEFVQ
jgi:DeoR/GlpR family transcriptional regulator of sugar metabolism